MAGMGYNNRKRGLGLGEEYKPATQGGGFRTGEYRPDDEAPAFEASPYDGDDGMMMPASDDGMGDQMEDQMGGDGWSDAERAFRDEVEADPENELYVRANEWKRKWMQRADQMKISPEQAMRVLDSIADLDAQQPGDPGYGQDDEPY